MMADYKPWIVRNANQRVTAVEELWAVYDNDNYSENMQI